MQNIQCSPFWSDMNDARMLASSNMEMKFFFFGGEGDFSLWPLWPPHDTAAYVDACDGFEPLSSL